AELVLLRAEGQWNFGPRSAPAVIDLLGTLDDSEWTDPALAERRATLLALALVTRGEAPDLVRARPILAQWIPRSTDPYRRDVLRALQGVCAEPPAVPVANQ
ncbi:MAG: hypothetical protein HZA53_08275, partial [Planctomycetes bacterium]|nr:hypothetical protein [Planctomycetota bacterium]